AIYSRAEAAMRTAIDSMPDGTYEGMVVSDSLGDSNEPIKIRAAVTIQGTSLDVDFAGSSDERPGSFNSVWTFSTAYTLYALRIALVPLFPNNAGFYRPLSVTCPPGTVVNARRPAATLSRHVVGHQVTDAVYAALAAIAPNAVFAQSGSAPSWDLLLTGEDTR